MQSGLSIVKSRVTQKSTLKLNSKEVPPRIKVDGRVTDTDDEDVQSLPTYLHPNSLKARLGCD